MSESVQQLKECLERERSARLLAERQLEIKNEALLDANQKLREHSQNIEREIRLRTSDLKSAHDQAVASAKAKSDFVANMSHELRTPLNGVIGMLYSLRNCNSANQQKALIKTALDSSKLLITVINDILDFSKIESVGVKLEQIEMDLRECVESIAHSFAVSSRAKQIDFITVIDPKLPRLVSADGFRIQQIVGNFISNAIKFTDKGYVKVQVDYLGSGRVLFTVKDTGVGISTEQANRIFSAFNQADTSVTRKYGGTGLGLSICSAIAKAMDTEIQLKSKLGEGAEFSFLLNLKVVDDNSLSHELSHVETPVSVAAISGSTMTLEVLHHLFVGQKAVELNVFKSICDYQLASNEGSPADVVLVDQEGKVAEEIKASKQSLCFGNARVAKLLYYEQLGDKNTESDFQLLKPLRNQEIVDAVLQPQFLQNIHQIESKQRTAYHEKRVLVVDDNVINLQVAENILQEFNLITELASNGQEAIDQVNSNHFDMVFMDVQMPGKDGLTAAKELRASGRSKEDLIIIAMTAHASREDRIKSLAAGMNDHVTKPIDPERIEQVLADYFGVKNSSSSTGNPVGELDKTENNIIDLEGFNVQEAIQRLGGNEALWRKLMLNFCDMYEGAAAEYAHHLNRQEYSKIAELAHRLKGSGANLGAEKISSAAAIIESAVKNNEIESLPDLIELNKVAMQTLTKAKRVLTGEPAVIRAAQQKDSTAPSVDRAQVVELLQGIKGTLNYNYTECENLVGSLTSLCAQSPFADLAAQISGFFEIFEYDQLLELVDEFDCKP